MSTIRFEKVGNFTFAYVTWNWIERLLTWRKESTYYTNTGIIWKKSHNGRWNTFMSCWLQENWEWSLEKETIGQAMRSYEDNN